MVEKLFALSLALQFRLSCPKHALALILTDFCVFERKYILSYVEQDEGFIRYITEKPSIPNLICPVAFFITDLMVQVLDLLVILVITISAPGCYQLGGEYTLHYKNNTSVYKNIWWIFKQPRRKQTQCTCEQ